jgi:NAD(P)-dependent dehydrogenase (short-subunit alcohol dehydrogenase family)
MKQAKPIPQTQKHQPGSEKLMVPKPESSGKEYQGSDKLQGKIAVITGGDSGIGRAVAVAFAKEGADVAIIYKEEQADAEETKRLVEKQSRQCLLLMEDIREETVCFKCIDQIVKKWKRVDILVNNAAVQFPQESIEDISKEQLENTFKTNIFSYFYMTKAALKHMPKGSAIINTTSVTAYKGKPQLIDYSSTKGAIVSFTRSLSLSLVDREIRVNGVAPGPIWTPLIPSSFNAEEVGKFGESAPMKRPGQPDEVAPSYVFLASADSSYMSGQILHINGGTIVNG